VFREDIRIKKNISSPLLLKEGWQQYNADLFIAKIICGRGG